MSEQTRLERWDQRTDLWLAGVAIGFLALYSVKVLVRPHGDIDRAVDIGLLAVYCIFVADYAVRLYLADPRGKWFVRHLWELPIIVLPFLRPLRLLSLAVVVNALQRAVGQTIHGKVIVYTACGAVAIVYAASLAILDVEGTHPESKIHTLGDALWWPTTTVTTVGYGDLSPVTPMGKLVAVALMIGGIAPGQRDRHAGVVDRAARGPGGRHRGGGDAGSDRRTPRRDPSTLELAHRGSTPRLW
jgi:voltage-gated potassium channel